MTKTLLLSFLFLSSILFGQTFTGTGGVITENQQLINFPLTVSGLSQNTLGASFGVTQVCLNITHTYDSDLNVWLVSPSGVSVNLFSGIGGSGNNFTNTCLNQSAANSINTGTPPFNATYKPQENLGELNNGANGNGVWRLRIQDTYPQDQGTLLNWSITFGPNAATPFVFTSSNLPIVLINTNNQTIVDEPSIVANMKIIYNGVGATNYVTDTTYDYNGGINIEIRGNYSQSLPQKPYKIETIDAALVDANVSLLGMPAESDWALLANYNDKVFMRNQLAYSLFSDMGHYAGRTKHCEVLINGHYQGIYILSETIKRDSNRVDIAKLTPDENTGLNITGGYIIKNDYWNSSTGWQLANSPVDHPGLVVGLAYHYPKADNISVQQKSYIANFITDFETALYSPNYANEIIGYKKFIDEPSFIDYFIINELSRNNDGFKKSSYFYKDKDSNTAISKLNAGPVWDFDWAWKNINECSFLSVTDGSGWAHWVNDCDPDVTSPGWYIRLLQDVNFQNDLRCRWESLRLTTLSLASLNAYIDETALYLNQAQSRHFNKWGNLGISTGAPEVDADPNTFTGQVTKFKNWIATRIAWLDQNIPGTATNCALNTPKNDVASLLIYQNPANSFTTVSTSNQENIRFLKIVDATGKVVFESYNSTSTKDFQVSTASLSNGIYILKIETESKAVITKKLIVLH